MNIIRCRIPGCKSEFKTNEPVAPGATYLCASREHTRQQQVEAVGRKYDPIKDEKDSDLHFQNTQFDPFIHRSVDGRQIRDEFEPTPKPSDGTDPDVDANLKAERNV